MVAAGPLKRTDCSLVSDGAAALILADLDTALAMDKAVVFRGAAQVNDFLPLSKREVTAFEGAALAWQWAFERSRRKLPGNANSREQITKQSPPAFFA